MATRSSRVDPSGLVVVDVSDPRHPRKAAVAPVSGSAWDVEVSDGIAYVANANTVSVIDVTSPETPVVLAAVGPAGIGIDVVGSLVFVAASDHGLRVLDVSDPAHPRALGSLETASGAWEVTVVGTLAYLADVEDGMRVIDVSHPETPAERGSG